jgi:tRNA-splicing ligase RtcB (3'-phosphate/5'-hydroxy nucleic acid ligase)
MRSDPYRERARALAVEAGLDPDAKVDRPGQRPVPVWCTFRDAARKEQVADEAAAVAATLPAQAPEFQNAARKVFGDHDDGTLAQMRNAMAVGNVVAGVICADGHLGYAQPDRPRRPFPTAALVMAANRSLPRMLAVLSSAALALATTSSAMPISAR